MLLTVAVGGKLPLFTELPKRNILGSSRQAGVGDIMPIGGKDRPDEGARPKEELSMPTENEALARRRVEAGQGGHPRW